MLCKGCLSGNGNVRQSDNALEIVRTKMLCSYLILYTHVFLVRSPAVYMYVRQVSVNNIYIPSTKSKDVRITLHKVLISVRPKYRRSFTGFTGHASFNCTCYTLQDYGYNVNLSVRFLSVEG